MINKAVNKHASDVSGSLNVYKITTTLDITSTGDHTDLSQQAWDTLVTIISMRSQPVVLTTPRAIDLATVEGSTMIGMGYVFEFCNEHKEVFATHDQDSKVVDPAGVLKIMFEDVVINGTALSVGDNIDIIVTDRY